MPIIEPLVVNYSFSANRRQATDLVDLTALNAVFTQFADKFNEIIDALNETTGVDNTLADGVIEERHLNDDVLDEITSMIREELTT